MSSTDDMINLINYTIEAERKRIIDAIGMIGIPCVVSDYTDGQRSMMQSILKIIKEEKAE